MGIDGAGSICWQFQQLLFVIVQSQFRLGMGTRTQSEEGAFLQGGAVGLFAVHAAAQSARTSPEQVSLLLVSCSVRRTALARSRVVSRAARLECEPSAPTHCGRIGFHRRISLSLWKPPTSETLEFVPWKPHHPSSCSTTWLGSKRGKLTVFSKPQRTRLFIRAFATASAPQRELPYVYVDYRLSAHGASFVCHSMLTPLYVG
jgi:hypothetical protein